MTLSGHGRDHDQPQRAILSLDGRTILHRIRARQVARHSCRDRFNALIAWH
jgi:hypothetical protein